MNLPGKAKYLINIANLTFKKLLWRSKVKSNGDWTRMYFGEIVKWSDWRYILQVVPMSFCYEISTKNDVKRCIV